MKIEPGQVFLVRHNGREDPFLVLAPRYREGEQYDVAFKWSVLNLATMKSVYMYESELDDPDPIEQYYAFEKLF